MTNASVIQKFSITKTFLFFGKCYSSIPIDLVWASRFFFYVFQSQEYLFKRNYPLSCFWANKLFPDLRYGDECCDNHRSVDAFLHCVLGQQGIFPESKLLDHLVWKLNSSFFGEMSIWFSIMARPVILHNSNEWGFFIPYSSSSILIGCLVFVCLFLISASLFGVRWFTIVALILRSRGTSTQRTMMPLLEKNCS